MLWVEQTYTECRAQLAANSRTELVCKVFVQYHPAKLTKLTMITMQPDANIIKDTVLSNSTYAFELKVLSRLQGADFQCVHNGAYSDSTTNKLREFDIYGHKFSVVSGKAFVHHVAVECKRIDPKTPLVVLGSEIATSTPFWLSPVYSLSGDNEALCTRYLPKEFIGRSMEQIQFKEVPQGKKPNQVINTEWNLNDADIFSKMSQAISSATAIVKDRLGVPIQGYSETFTEVTPVLVVPDGTLWTVEFNNVGDINGMPKPSTALRYFIDYRCEENATGRTNRTVDIQHMTICTESALISTLESSEICSLACDYQINPNFKPIKRQPL